MVILALIVSFALLVLAAIHSLWGIGYWFPLRDEVALVRAVIGTKGVTRMPGPVPCGLVAAGLLIVLIAIWGMTGWTRIVVLALGGASFGLRGFLGFTRIWKSMTPQQPFAMLDRLFYSPFAVAMAIGLVILIWSPN